MHTLLEIRWYCRTGVINVIFRITLKIDRSEAALSKGVIITMLFTPPPPFPLKQIFQKKNEYTPVDEACMIHLFCIILDILDAHAQETK